MSTVASSLSTSSSTPSVAHTHSTTSSTPSVAHSHSTSFSTPTVTSLITSSHSSPTNERPRSIFTFDGCWQQLNAVMGSLNKEFTGRGCEDFKFAAATTCVEQPNDVGHCHKAIKNYYKGKKLKSIVEWTTPPYLEGFREILEHAGLESGSLESYWKALCHIEICLSKTCTIPMVQEGYKISGIYPLNNEAILLGWSGWSLCSKVKANELISLQ